MEQRLHSVNEVDEADRRVWLASGILVVERWGHGCGSVGAARAAAPPPRDGGLHRVDPWVLGCSTRAIACWERCGFVREGLERASALVDDRWRTDAIRSMLEREFRGHAADRFPTTPDTGP